MVQYRQDVAVWGWGGEGLGPSAVECTNRRLTRVPLWLMEVGGGLRPSVVARKNKCKSRATIEHGGCVVGCAFFTVGDENTGGA